MNALNQLEALARAYDREDASQRGEPDPWDDGKDDAAWVAERLACAQAGFAALSASQEAAAPSEEPVAEFGEGKLVIDTGTFRGRPAVFIAPAKMPGEIGASAAREGHDLHSLQPGEIVLTFPTDEQARAVEAALLASPAPVAGVGVSVKGLEQLAREIAVTMVDAIHGYTVEFAPSPSAHLDEYNRAENAARYALSSTTKCGEDDAAKLPRLTEKMMRAACKAHYGDDNIDGVALTSVDIDYSFRDAFKRMWSGVRAALSAQDTDGVAK